MSRITTLYFLIFLSLYLQNSFGQQPKNPGMKWPVDIEKSLAVAGDNRSELEKVLNHYSAKPSDSLKYKAVAYLIRNMVWHYSAVKLVPEMNKLSLLVAKADSLYYSLVRGKNSKELAAQDVNAGVMHIRKQILEMMTTLDINDDDTQILTDINDTEDHNARFLIEQVEHAFWLRQNAPLVRKLSFAEFCQTILPYKFVNEKYVSRSAPFFYNFFSKYLGEVKNDKDSIIENIHRYNITIANFKKILGNYPLPEKVGFEELLFVLPFERWDCFDLTNFGALILNACGLPIKIEYNVTGKLFAGSHSTGAFLNVPGLNQFTFETTVPSKIAGKGYWRGLMNFYQICFEPQTNTPFFLKEKNEVTPTELSSPLLKDMSYMRVDTTTVTLPFKLQTSNKLAYLATFNRITGISCTSWGLINKKTKTVSFRNAIPGSLYFPVYLNGETKVLFGSPFFLKVDSIKDKVVYSKRSFDIFKKRILDSVFITRKFPEKAPLRALSKELVGTFILASDSSDFKNADTVYVLDYIPKFEPQDLVLKTKRAYRYYRIVAPKLTSRVTLGEIEFLTNKSFNYKNTIAPTPLYRFNFSDRGKIPDSGLTKITDNINRRLPQYDGNVETAPRQNIYITQQFSQPTFVTHLRIIPLNANNGIVPGNQYILYCWEDGDWKKIGEVRKATDQFLFFDKLETNKIYWLKNITRGREEAPFILDEEGQQRFFYTDIFNELRWT